MICPRCLAEIPDVSDFCPSCGLAMRPGGTGRVEAPKAEKRREPMSTMSLGLALILVLLLATTAISPLAMTTHSSERTITIQPYSHYTLRFSTYGLGFRSYSVEALSAPLYGFALLEMNKENYNLYSSGETYSTLKLVPLVPGTTVTSSEAGLMWVKYVVFFNATPATVTVTVGYSSIPIFSFYVAIPLFSLGMLAFVFIASTRRLSRKQQTSKLGHQ